MGQQSPVTDRHLGIFVDHDLSFADARARSQAFDEARARKARRDRKKADQLTHADFQPGDVVVVAYKEYVGRLIYGCAVVVDSYTAPSTRASWQRRDGSVYVRFLRCTEAAYVGHITQLHYGDGHVLPWSSVFVFCTKSLEEYVELHAAAMSTRDGVPVS